MKIIGIVGEYNPFHNGHIYHIQKIKEMFPELMIILVMSGNFTQRGIPSIMSKWEKCEIALKYGVDLVVELPFSFATQSADIFAHGAISILKELHAEYLVFGSESNDIEMLTQLAEISIKNTLYQKKMKDYLEQGFNYPTALNKAFQEFGVDMVTSPNDLLGLSYIKEIIKQDASIIPLTIQRTNSYHDLELVDSISSATSIRKAILEKKSIQNVVPKEVYELLQNSHFTQDAYFPFLKYKIMSTDDLSIFQTVEEGIENRIKKYIEEATSWEDLVHKIKTKRYTYNKINRMLLHILCNFTKEQATQWKEIEYIRVLGFRKIGQNYLNRIKKETMLPIITTFSKGNSKMLDYEKTITSIYASILAEDEKRKFIQSEYQTKPKTSDF